MNKELEDSINMLKNTDISTIENAENTDLLTYSYAVKTVLKYIENSTQKENMLNEKYIDNIREGQFIGITKLQYKEYLYLRKNSILKKVVEEKIEQLEDLLDLCKTDGRISKYKIKALEEEIEDFKELLEVE